MQALMYPHLMAVTPLKRLRVDETLWENFGDAAEALGLDRTKVLVAFMHRFVDAMAVRSASPDHAAERPHSAA